MRLFKQKEFILVFAILVLALGLRLWKIDQYMNFLGDEGRDAIIVSKIFTEGNLPFIGPPTSVGNMYLGPLYYYMMAVPMFVSGQNPVSAAVMIAIIGTLTVGLIYFLGRIWFGIAGAGLAAFLYAVSPIAIVYSKSSWNPNPAPFFGLLILLSIYFAHKTHNYRWVILTGVIMAAILQMHYLSLVLLPIIGFFWFGELVIIARNKSLNNFFWRGTILGVVAFLLLMSPLVLFDLKHDFMNWHAFETIVSGKDVTVTQSGVFEKIWPIYQSKLLGRYMAGNNQFLAILLGAVLVLPLFWIVFLKLKKRAVLWIWATLYIWLLVGVIGVANYRGEIYDHYLGFLSPLPYLILAGVISLIQNFRIRLVVVMLIALIIGYFNVINSPLSYPPNNQLQRTKDVSSFIIKEAEGKDFNFALLSENNYDAAYQFFMRRSSENIKELPKNRTEVLFVVCEDPVCQPIGNAKYEIAAFGWAKQEWVKEVDGVKIYKLIPNPDQPKQLN